VYSVPYCEGEYNVQIIQDEVLNDYFLNGCRKDNSVQNIDYWYCDCINNDILMKTDELTENTYDFIVDYYLIKEPTANDLGLTTEMFDGNLTWFNEESDKRIAIEYDNNRRRNRINNIVFNASQPKSLRNIILTPIKDYYVIIVLFVVVLILGTIIFYTIKFGKHLIEDKEEDNTIYDDEYFENLLKNQ